MESLLICVVYNPSFPSPTPLTLILTVERDTYHREASLCVPVEQFLSLGSLLNVFLEKCVQHRQVKRYHGNRDFDFVLMGLRSHAYGVTMQVQLPSPKQIYF